jgi:hypothetical protein
MATPDEIAAAWRDALALWDVGTTLSPPEPLAKVKGSHWPGDEPLAFIDMVRRQVVVNFELLAEIGAAGSLTAVLAHEIGHHVRFPHTLQLAAQLQMIEQRLLPGLASSLTNLFFDLQVNEVVGRTRAGELAAVYRGFVGRAPEIDPVFWFYLAIYEELWGLPTGELAPAAAGDAFERRWPGARGEARVFAQTFWALPDTFVQFVYFCSRFARYLPEPSRARAGAMPLAGDVPRPDLDDWDGALQSGDAVERALEEGAQRGWVPKRGPHGPQPPPAGTDALGRMTSMPGTAQAEFRAVLAERHYRRLVDRYLIEIPGSAPPPDPLIPTTLEEWLPGDDPRAIDWTASVMARGALAAAMPLQREREPDVPQPSAAELPAVEIYLDTSGSMPNPAYAENAMTLAALVLATAATRRGGSVRGVIYSYGDPRASAWIQDEELARKTLLYYAGGGTLFPFDLLEKHARERRDVLRVVISDGDFLSNVQSEKNALTALAEGVAASRVFAALLHLHPTQHEGAAKLLGGLDPARFRLVPVADAAGLGAAARALADALIPPPGGSR